MAVEVNLHDNYFLQPLFGMKKYQKSWCNSVIVLRSTCGIADFFCEFSPVSGGTTACKRGIRDPKDTQLFLLHL